MNEGWLCPRCQRVNAPHVDQCGCKAEEKTVVEQGKDDNYLRRLREALGDPPKPLPLEEFAKKHGLPFPPWHGIPAAIAATVTSTSTDGQGVVQPPSPMEKLFSLTREEVMRHEHVK